MHGFDSTLTEVFPKASRRIFAQHLYSNCKDNGFSGKAFHDLFCDKACDKIINLDEDAYAYMQTVDEDHQWSRHVFDPEVCCDHNTTNFVESFNATKPYRGLPVMSMLEGTIYDLFHYHFSFK